jgi:SAM-dependent methyltransferase
MLAGTRSFLSRTPVLPEPLTRAASYWSDRTRQSPRRLDRWWHHPCVIERIGALAGVRGCRSIAALDAALLRRQLGERRFRRAISIGCGEARKEMGLLGLDLVEHFTLAEIAELRVQRGQELALQRGLERRTEFHRVDALAHFREPAFDLVYWNNALHHMLDVRAALQWSRSVLVEGGVLYVNDFVGPNRMQLSACTLQIGTALRRTLPAHLLRGRGRWRAGRLCTELSNVDPEDLASRDPTECADSERILPELRALFPTHVLAPLGGVIYHTALNDVLANLDPARDSHWLDLAFELEHLCIEAGRFQYAAAIASEPP